MQYLTNHHSNLYVEAFQPILIIWMDTQIINFKSVQINFKMIANKCEFNN